MESWAVNQEKFEIRPELDNKVSIHVAVENPFGIFFLKDC